MAKVTAVTTVFPHTTAQILTQSQDSEKELNEPMFHVDNTRVLSTSLFLCCRHMLPQWWVVSRVVIEKLIYDGAK